VQMTSDMLPSDIVGTLRLKGGDFEFRPGPIFSHVLLADELNRTSSKTQSALLEAMAEGRVTVDGNTHPLPDPFFVVATQNPHEFQGVYPLAESQLDRFMMHIELSLPGEEAELGLMRRHGRGEQAPAAPAGLRPEDWIALRESCRKIFLEESLTAYAQKIAQRVRQARDVAHGASVRSMLQLLDAAKARAFLSEREFVAPEDIQAVAPAVLGHRLCMRGPELGARERKELIREAMGAVAVPR
jgi:MoxR-like ATPase